MVLSALVKYGAFSTIINAKWNILNREWWK